MNFKYLPTDFKPKKNSIEEKYYSIDTLREDIKNEVRELNKTKNEVKRRTTSLNDIYGFSKSAVFQSNEG